MDTASRRINRKFGLKAQFAALFIFAAVLLLVFALNLITLHQEKLQELESTTTRLALVGQLITINQALEADATENFHAAQADTTRPLDLPGITLLQAFIREHLKDLNKVSQDRLLDPGTLSILLELQKSDESRKPGDKLMQKVTGLLSKTRTTTDKLIAGLIDTLPDADLKELRDLHFLKSAVFAKQQLIREALKEGTTLDILIDLQQLTLSEKLQLSERLLPERQQSRQDLATSLARRLVEKHQLLHEFDEHFGYQGFVFSFQNLLLQGPELYRDLTNRKILQAIRSIDTLSHYHSLTQENRRDMITLRDTVINYTESVEQAAELWKQKKPVPHIHRQVSVDNSAAIDALSNLKTQVYQPELHGLLASSTEHLIQLNNAIHQRYQRLAETISQQIDRRTEKLWVYVAALGAGFLILMAAMALITRRLIQRILHLQDVLHYLEEQDDLNTRAREDTTDEIGQIGAALNRAICHRREIENKLVSEKKKATQAAAAKTSFLAGMSHQMKTPLNAIIGYSQRLIGKHTDTGSREYDALKMISSNGKLLLDRVEHILKLVYVESTDSKARYAQGATPLNDLKNLINAQLSGISQWQATLHWQTGKNPPLLGGSGESYQEIISHLMAPDNFPPNSSPDIYVWLEGDNCLLEIVFAASEMKDSQLKELFSAGAGLINPVSNNHEGSNLNLAIVQGVLLHLGGKGTACRKDQKIHYLLQLPLRQPEPAS